MTGRIAYNVMIPLILPLSNAGLSKR